MNIAEKILSIKRIAKDEVIIPVRGFEDHYLVSNYRRVFSLNYRHKKGRVKELDQSYLRDCRRKNKTMRSIEVIRKIGLSPYIIYDISRNKTWSYV